MPRVDRSVAAVVMTLLGAHSGGAAAEEAASTNYLAIEAKGEARVQIGYYASADKSCTPAELPEIRVIAAPSAGTFRVQKAVLTTNRVAGCPQLKVPALVAFYQARPGAAGADRVVYQVRYASGELASYDVSITIKPDDKRPPAPAAADRNRI